jgi:hypothetical protein
MSILFTLLELMPYDKFEVRDAEGKSALDLARVSDQKYIDREQEVKTVSPQLAEGVRHAIHALYIGMFQCHRFAPLADLIKAYRIYVTTPNLSMEDEALWDDLMEKAPRLRHWKDKRAAYLAAMQ